MTDEQKARWLLYAALLILWIGVFAAAQTELKL